MTYFADLSPYQYSKTHGDDDALNIGWLDSAHRFKRGQVTEEFTLALFTCCRFPVNVMRGFHICHFCDDPRIMPLKYECDSARIALGFAEIRVEHEDGTRFAAPNLIYHYVVDHRYQPPKPFIEAVLRTAKQHDLKNADSWT